MGVPGRICPGSDAGRGDRRLFRRKRPARLGLHGRVRVRRRARQQGKLRLPDGTRRSAKARRVHTDDLLHHAPVHLHPARRAVDFAEIGRHWLGGIAVVTVLMLIARPATVFVCALPDRRARWSFQEMLFMCWTRETGVIPAALAGLLLGANAPGATTIASVTFVAILMTILIQAPTTQWLARRLGLMEETNLAAKRPR